jgi:hypothetical protein
LLEFDEEFEPESDEEFDDELEPEFDEEFELELELELDEEFELEFDEELEFELELEFDEEFEFEFDDELEFEFDEELLFELDEPALKLVGPSSSLVRVERNSVRRWGASHWPVIDRTRSPNPPPPQSARATVGATKPAVDTTVAVTRVNSRFMCLLLAVDCG